MLETEETVTLNTGFAGFEHDVTVSMFRLNPSPDCPFSDRRLYRAETTIPIDRRDHYSDFAKRALRDAVDTLVNHVDSHLILSRLAVAKGRKKRIRKMQL